MPQDSAIRGLDQVLARLYPSEDDARRVVDLAGIPLAFVKFTGNAVVMWFAIIQEAAKRKRVGSLIDVALTDYSDDADLVAAKSQLSQSAPASPVSRLVPQQGHRPTNAPPTSGPGQAAEFAKHLSPPAEQDQKAEPPIPKANAGNNPWRSGSFYLVVMVVLVALAAGLSWVFIQAGIPAAGALTLVLTTLLACAGVLLIIGTVQQTQDEKITPENAARRIELGFQAIRQAISPTPPVGPTTKEEKSAAADANDVK
jgi:hypothetical protein